MATTMFVGQAKLAAQVVLNGSFETVTSPIDYTVTFGSMSTNAVTNWTFGVSSVATSSFDGLEHNGGLDISNIPDGINAAFIQGTGSISQVVSGFSGGNTFLLFMLEKRGGGLGPQPLTVTMDSTPLTFGGQSTVSPTVTSSFVLFTSDAFSVSAGSHTLTIAGTIPFSTADLTTAIDEVSVIPEPAILTQVGLMLLGGCCLRAWRRRK